MMRTDSKRNASLFGAMGAAVVASACCVGPLIFALLGIGGAGALVALEPYRPLFTVLTLALLGVGFYLTYRSPAPASVAVIAGLPSMGVTAAGDACGCEMPRTNRTGRALLWVATAVAGAALLFPYITPYLFA